MSFVYTTNLSEVRALAEKHARMAGLPADRVIDFVVAVGEVAANTVRHARSQGTMEIWDSRDGLVCEIRDAGVIADLSHVGRPPGPGATGGFGLWLVYQVCDQVDVRSDQNGTVIRMRVSAQREPAR